MKKIKDEDLEIVAAFQEDNNNFIVRQPMKETSLEDQKKFHNVLAKAAFKHQK